MRPGMALPLDPGTQPLAANASLDPDAASAVSEKEALTREQRPH